MSAEFLAIERGWLQPSVAVGSVTLAAFLALVFFYSFGPGVCVWLVLSELLPTRIRANGMAIAGPFNRTNDSQFVQVWNDGETEPHTREGRTGGLPVVGTGTYSRRIVVPEGCGYASLVFDGVMDHSRVFADFRARRCETPEDLLANFPDASATAT